MPFTIDHIRTARAGRSAWRVGASGIAYLLVVLLAPERGIAALSGPEIYDQACAACHGSDGRGAPTGTAIEVPLPDFTDCKFVTAESTANWFGLVKYGGKFLGLSPQMPGFGDVLSDAEIRSAIDQVRGFCTDERWPVGDLNFPRLVFVEKAFPEDELVASFFPASARHENVYEGETSGEMRIGPRGWLEASVPVAGTVPDTGSGRAGVGDAAIAYRQAILVAPAWRSIASAGVELAIPTGNRHHGVGSGTPVVEPQLLSGHALGPLVAQAQIIALLPGDAERVGREMLYRVALQYPLGPYKKNLVPAIELEQSQALDSAVRAYTVLGPSLYVPLSRRGHVAVGVGAQLPVAGTRPFDWRLGSFLLWEYNDGPFWAW